MPTSSNKNPLAAGTAQFANTHWSVVLLARQDRSPQVNDALENLCRTYWFPLYAYVRRCGYSVADAEDLTQEFFARLLSKDYLRAVDRKKGKFRSFLLAALEHFLANEWRRSKAQKRGGKVAFISLDDDCAERRYAPLAASGIPPEKQFERQWAVALLEQVLGRLRDEFAAAGKAALFAEVKIFLTGEKRPASYAELAAKLGTTEAALKMAVSRMRQRYGELLRAEIANTVGSPAEVEDELRALFAALN